MRGFSEFKPTTVDFTTAARYIADISGRDYSDAILTEITAILQDCKFYYRKRFKLESIGDRLWYYIIIEKDGIKSKELPIGISLQRLDNNTALQITDIIDVISIYGADHDDMEDKYKKSYEEYQKQLLAVFVDPAYLAALGAIIAW